MSGSIINLGYFNDNNDIYQVRIDKSNSIGMGFVNITSEVLSTSTVTLPPKFFKMREIRVQCNAEPKIVRTIPIGNITTYNAIILAGFIHIQRYPTMSPERFNILDSRGERRKTPRLTTPDTVLNDTET
jgi:hypothetical protein